MEGIAIKKILSFVLVLMLMLSLAACGGGSVEEARDAPQQEQTSDKPEAAAPALPAGEWPDNEWTQKAPKPAAGTVGEVGTMGADNQTLYIIMSWTREEAAGYANATREQALIIAARMVKNLGK